MKLKALILSACLIAIALPATASDPDVFSSITRLSAAQEVAEVPVESDGTAQAVAVFDAELSKLQIFVRFNNLVGSEVTRLHFHCQIAGQNGPVAIGIIDRLNPGNDNSQDVVEFGNLIFAELDNENFPGGDDRCISQIGQPVTNIASLAAAIDAGEVYWNLHTDAFPPGELRGQVRPLRDGINLRALLPNVQIDEIEAAGDNAETTLPDLRDLQLNR